MRREAETGLAWLLVTVNGRSGTLRYRLINFSFRPGPALLREL